VPLRNYGIWNGWITHRLRSQKNGDHYQILFTSGEITLHRIAVNVLSKVNPSELLYFTTETLPAAMKTNLKAK